MGWAAVAAVVVIPRPSAAQQSTAALGAEAPSAKAAPVFTKDVAPILQEKCQACHRPGYIAPMAFMTFEETRPWARSIKARVAARQMPPWHIDKAVGIQHFKNDRSLSDKEIDTIVRWVDAGAPKGDPKDMPPPKTFARDDVWNFAELYGGPPDLIVKSPAYTTPAQALDQWFKPVVETGLTETRWVRAIEIRPATVKGRKVTHHALARLQQDDPDQNLTSDGGGAGLFMEWAVGKQGEIMRANSGKLMLPGAKIIFEVHYHAVGEEITDQVELGIYFYPKGQEPKYRQVPRLAQQHCRRRAQHRHSPERDVREPELPRHAAGRSRGELPAAHAPARQGDVDGSDSSQRHHTDVEPREQLQFQLAQQLRVRR